MQSKKPDPDGLLKCITHLDLHTSNGTIVYIGDHETDAHCAFNANKALEKKRVVSVGALYEKDSTYHRWNYQPDYIASTTDQVIKILQSII